MQLFSLTHILYLLSCILICIIFYFLFRNKSKKTQKISILTILLTAFILHFLKLLTPEYKNNLPSSLISITPETLCAASTLIFPFIFISKNEKLKDYMLIFGTISGLATLLIPADLVGSYDWIEITRFFFAHLTIFICPFFMFIFNIHKPTRKWIKNTLLTLILITIICTLDNILFIYLLEGKDALLSYLT